MDTIPTIIVDSLSYGGQVDILKEMLSQQASTYNTFIIVLIAILSFLAGISWWRYAIVSRNAIQKMKTQVLNELADVQEKTWGKFQEEFKDDRKEQFEELENKLLVQEATFNRLTATQLTILAESDKNRPNLINWWILALKSYLKLKDGKQIRLSLDFILRILNEIEDIEVFSETIIKINDSTLSKLKNKIITAIEPVSNSMEKEKKKIRDIVNEWDEDKHTD